VTILLIDDAPIFVRALAHLLRRDGATVDTAGTGQRALAQLQERRYDVILCDLRMSDLDGPGFYALVQRQYASLHQRVVFLTGDVGNAASLAFLTQCGQPWLAKPCTVAAVRSAIQQVLDNAAPVQEPGKAGRIHGEQSQQLRRQSQALRRLSQELAGKKQALCAKSQHLWRKVHTTSAGYGWRRQYPAA
jgi:CheY-like chemotaxis protein